MSLLLDIARELSHMEIATPGVAEMNDSAVKITCCSPKDQSSVPHTAVGWLITPVTSASGDDILFRLLQREASTHVAEIHIQINL